MDVTSTNFHQILTELEEILTKAAFVSIDGEFTGLNDGKEKTNSCDTPEEYYRKIRTGSLDFLFIQFGLAVFHLDEKTKAYKHRDYNFYIFPNPSLPGVPDCRYCDQASSMKFLAKNKFDFNKLIYEGIPYLNQLDEEIAKRKLLERREGRAESLLNNLDRSIPIPEEYNSTVTKAIEQIAEFLQDKTKDHTTLEGCNSFGRKLIYQEAWKKFSRDELSLESNSYNITARRTTAAQRIEEDKMKLEKENEGLNNAMGFTNVIKLLSNSNKLIVGHNMLLDLCHILHRFCMPIPEEYEEFKAMMHLLFPNIIDTKYLCTHIDLKYKLPSSTLKHLVKDIQQAPFCIPSVEPELPDYGYSINDDKAHEAGYDAYVTGLVYITLSDYLCKVNYPRPRSLVLKDSINRLYMMRSHDSHMNLAGPDPKINRDHVFHITFPRDWELLDINQIFRPYGTIFVDKLTDTTALVSLRNKYNSLQVEHNLVRNKMNSTYKVTSYDTYVNNIKSAQASNKIKDILSTQSPSLTEAKKRKLAEDIGKPVKRQCTNISARRSTQSIESIPEEDENDEEVKVNNRSAFRMQNSTSNGSLADNINNPDWTYRQPGGGSSRTSESFSPSVRVSGLESASSTPVVRGSGQGIDESSTTPVVGGSRRVRESSSPTVKGSRPVTESSSPAVTVSRRGSDPSIPRSRPVTEYSSPAVGVSRRGIESSTPVVGVAKGSRRGSDSSTTRSRPVTEYSSPSVGVSRQGIESSTPVVGVAEGSRRGSDSSPPSSRPVTEYSSPAVGVSRRGIESSTPVVGVAEGSRRGSDSSTPSSRPVTEYSSPVVGVSRRGIESSTPVVGVAKGSRPVTEFSSPAVRVSRRGSDSSIPCSRPVTEYSSPAVGVSRQGIESSTPVVGVAEGSRRGSDSSAPRSRPVTEYSSPSVGVSRRGIEPSTPVVGVAEDSRRGSDSSAPRSRPVTEYSSPAVGVSRRGIESSTPVAGVAKGSRRGSDSSTPVLRSSRLEIESSAPVLKSSKQVNESSSLTVKGSRRGSDTSAPRSRPVTEYSSPAVGVSRRGIESSTPVVGVAKGSRRGSDSSTPVLRSSRLKIESSAPVLRSSKQVNESPSLTVKGSRRVNKSSSSTVRGSRQVTESSSSANRGPSVTSKSSSSGTLNQEVFYRDSNQTVKNNKKQKNFFEENNDWN